MRGMCFTFALFVALCGAPGAGKAETYPVRPVRLISAVPAGGSGDMAIRMVTDQLAQQMKQGIVNENRPGPNGVVAALAAKSAEPDGYTLLALGNVHAIGQSLLQNPPYDVLNSFIPIVILGYTDVAILASANSKIKTVQDFIQSARANQQAVSIGTSAAGTTQYLTAELFRSKANLKIPIVPFRTPGDLMNAVGREDVNISFELVPTVLGLIKGGSMVALAVSSETRFPDIPNVPTFRESGDFPTVIAWTIIAAPLKTPQSVVETMNREINKALSDKELQEKYLQMGYRVGGGSPQQAQELLKSEVYKWRDVVKQSNIVQQ